MKILITGSNGFIGKNIVEKLSSSNEFLSLDHKTTDLTSFSDLSRHFKNFGPDATIHCAAKPGHRLAVDNKDLTLINLQMFTAINKCTETFNTKKFICIGSGSEYSMNQNLKNVSEDNLGNVIPKDETGFPRYIINNLIKLNPRSLNLRCFGVFGKYENYNMRFISYAITRAILNKDIIINEDKRFSYLYIDDLVKIIDIFLINKNKHHDYNIVPDYVYTMSQIANTIIETAKSTSQVKVLNKGFDYTANNTRFKSEFDFNFTPFNIAIKELCEYYLSIKNELVIEG